jgi:peptidoglycan/LPS O-acetylase OafA/YrhL
LVVLLPPSEPENLDPSTTVWIIDLLKIAAAQVILWHHFCRYGPMARTLELAGHSWVSFVGQHGRHAVQVFLVVSGFLAARSIAKFFDNSSVGALVESIRRSWLTRARRLALPYWLMLVSAVLFAGIARLLQADSDTPAAPQWFEWLAHLLFLQNLLGMDSLSTGVWYVAVDLQLSFLFLALLFASGWLSSNKGKLNRAAASRTVEIIVWILMLCSLIGFNRWQTLDPWAIYFFGSFGMGVVVGMRPKRPSANSHLFVLMLIMTVGAAVALDWRSGLVIALICAVVLWWMSDLPAPRAGWVNYLKPLSRDSYALFLFHYPVILLVGSLVNYFWPQQTVFAALGLVVGWLLSMMVAFYVSRLQRS